MFSELFQNILKTAGLLAMHRSNIVVPILMLWAVTRHEVQHQAKQSNVHLGSSPPRFHTNFWQKQYPHGNPKYADLEARGVT